MKKIQLLLTNPCSQKWENMKTLGSERYCDNCEKHIVDLTTKSDAELIQFFRKKKDNVCGRLLDSQLNRDLIVPAKKTNWQWLLPLAVGAIITSPAQANTLSPLIAQSEPVFVGHKAADDSTLRAPVTTSPITGTVLDKSSGKPIRGVKVMEKGHANVLALTDSAGKFELDQVQASLASLLVFEITGYRKIESKPINGMVINLVVEQRLVLGGVSTFSLNSSSSRQPLFILYAGKKNCSIDQ